MVDKVVELLQNVDYIRVSGATKPRNEPSFGQGNLSYFFAQISADLC